MLVVGNDGQIVSLPFVFDFEGASSYLDAKNGKMVLSDAMKSLASRSIDSSKLDDFCVSLMTECSCENIYAANSTEIRRCLAEVLPSVANLYDYSMNPERSYARDGAFAQGAPASRPYSDFLMEFF